MPVYQADFWRIGVAICFDINFPEVWKTLADQGAELVVWPSAYSAGTALQARALNHRYYIVSATINATHVTLELDRGILPP